MTEMVTKGTVEYPHPFVVIYMGTKRYASEMYPRPLPGAGGWLDQDAWLMLGLEVCEDLYDQEQAVKKAFEENRAKAEAQRARR